MTHHGMPLNLRADNRIQLRDAAGRYLGALTFYYGEGWTHTLLRFEAPPLASADDAETDFYETKARLPADVHKQLFS